MVPQHGQNQSPQGLGSVLTEYFVNGTSAATQLTIPPRPAPQLDPRDQRVVRLLGRALDAAAGGDQNTVKAALRRAQWVIHQGTQSLLPQGIDVQAIRTQMAQIPHGLPPLKALAGVRPIVEFGPGLNIVAAPTSAGKTTILLQQIIEWLTDAQTGTGKILLWSCETPAEFAVAKLIANVAECTMWAVIDAERKGTAVSPNIYTAWQTLGPVLSRLIILDEPTTAQELCEVAARLTDEPDGLTALVVDYIQELPAVPARHPDAAKYARSRELEVGAVAQMLREFGHQTQTPVLSAAQFNRTVGKSADYVPDLQQLRESGRIEQNATVVLGLRNSAMSGATLRASSNGGVAAEKTYSAWNAKDLEDARQGAMLSVRHEHHAAADDWTLVEAFVLKNRYHGGVGTVIPFALQPEWGRCEPIQSRATVFGGGGGRKPAASGSSSVDQGPEKDGAHDGSQSNTPDWL